MLVEAHIGGGIVEQQETTAPLPLVIVYARQSEDCGPDFWCRMAQSVNLEDFWLDTHRFHKASISGD